MKILLAAAEAAPLIKVGGLGDVAGSLPRALNALGHDVRVVIPHIGIDETRYKPAPVARVAVPGAAGTSVATVSRVRLHDLTYYLVAGPAVPKGGPVYDGHIETDGPKFVFFSLAALGLCRALGWKPDIFHCNDYHTAAAACWLGTLGRQDSAYHEVASVLTVHNLGYMGTGAGAALRAYGLAPSESDLLPDWARDSLLGVGLEHAHMVSTVSPGYAAEIMTPAYGYGLERLLQARGNRVTGILNRIDVDVWNPQTDRAVRHHYDAGTLDDRAPNKRVLQREVGLAMDDSRPLLGMVSRLDAQKGFDIAGPAVRHWLASGGQFVLLGTGQRSLMAEFEAIGDEFGTQAAVLLRFDPALASRIYAGADMLFIPSRYEPCGLTQMIAMRYGAIPIVRRTGGLADTVKDDSAPRGTGFVFRDYTPEAAWTALERAAEAYRTPRRWRGLQRRAMRQDFSWDRSARAYVRLYQRATAFRRASLQSLGGNGAKPPVERPARAASRRPAVSERRAP